MSDPLFRVLLPDGKYTRLYSKEQIRKAFLANKISKRATVIVGGSDVGISDFLSGGDIPLATKKQRDFAERLGISFERNINRAEISRLIDQALKKQHEEQSPDAFLTLVPIDDDEERERIRQEILDEMREDGSIPLSQATPDDISKHFENVRDLDMVILYSPNNTFELLILAQQAEDIKGTEIRVCRPEWMSRSAMRSLLLMIAPSIRD